MQFTTPLFLAALVAAVAAGDNKNWSNHQTTVDNSKATTHQTQGAGFACRRGDLSLIARGDFVMNGNSGVVDNASGNLGNCAFGERSEEHEEERDILEGLRTLEILEARGSNTDWKNEQMTYDGSSASTVQQGGASLQCRRGSFIMNGNSGHVSNKGGNMGNCLVQRSTDLALRDLGAMTRRFQARSLPDEHQDLAAEYLRRHAVELELIADSA